MRLYSYNREVQKVTTQVLSAFKNIVVRRIGKDNLNRITYKPILVPLVLSNRSRIMKSLENRNKTLKLPMMALTFNGINSDTERVQNVNDVLLYSTSSLNMIQNVAVPIIINYELTIVTRLLEEMDQIVTNITALMNPDIYVVVPNPKGNGNIKVQLIWDRRVSYVDKRDSTRFESPERVVASLGLIAKYWIFPGYDEYDDSGDRITHINLCKYYGNGSGDSQSELSAVALTRWYDVRNEDIDYFMDNVRAGLIQYPNYDEFEILDALSGSFWLNNMYAVLSGSIYDFNVSSDLETLIANADSSDLTVTTIKNNGAFFTPCTLSAVDWKPVWQRMLSGDLSECRTDDVSEQTYKYLLSDDSYVFLLYDDFTLMPLTEEP